VYPVIWYPAKSHAPPDRADSSPIVPWRTVATGAVRLPKAGAGLRQT
jgi:hypothetical protein